MVGDSEVDIATAAAAGIPSIGVTFGYTTVPVRELAPTAVIDHYREFMPALAKVLGEGQASLATTPAENRKRPRERSDPLLAPTRRATISSKQSCSSRRAVCCRGRERCYVGSSMPQLLRARS